MPWQPSHIRVFCWPFAALPACGAGACAQASAAAHESSAAVVSCLIIRCRSGGSVNAWVDRKLCRVPRAGCRRRDVEKPSNSMRCSVAGSMRAVSAFEKLHLLADILPVVGVGRCRLALDDRLPQLRKLGIDRRELDLLGRHVILGEDRLYRAFGDAQRAIDALVGIDDQEIGTLAKTVHRANVDTIGVLLSLIHISEPTRQAEISYAVFC